MPALDTVAQYLEEARRLLQDEVAPFRYPDDDIVDALNIGLMEARRLRADLFLPLFDVRGQLPLGRVQPAQDLLRPSREQAAGVGQPDALRDLAARQVEVTLGVQPGGLQPRDGAAHHAQRGEA